MILDKNNPETRKQKMLGTLNAEVLERNGIPWQGLGNKWAIGSKQKKKKTDFTAHCLLPNVDSQSFWILIPISVGNRVLINSKLPRGKPVYRQRQACQPIGRPAKH